MSHDGLSQLPGLAPGQVLAQRYRLERRLGEGGLGTAFFAADLARGTAVALKLLRDATAERLEIFRNEFSTLSGLLHPHLARVHDFGSARLGAQRSVCFYTSDFVQGSSLAEFARERTWPDVVPVIAKALSALAFLHRFGVRHGDFKSDNVLVTASGEPRLIDLSCSAPFGDNRTRSGTRGYIAPEVGRATRADGRADLYSVGVALQDLFSVLAAPPPADVVALAAKLREPRPEDRPLDVASVLEQLGVTKPEQLTLSPQPPRLLEREHELSRFSALLASLARAEPGPRALWLRGDPGSGKTRLLNEMKWRAQLEVRVGQADAIEARPVRAMLSRALGEPVGDELGALLAARDRLARDREPTLLVVDHAELFPAAV